MQNSLRRGQLDVSILKSALLFIFLTLISLFWFSSCHSRGFLAVCLFASLFVSVLYWIMKKGLFRTAMWGEAPLISALLLMGLIFIFLFPPGSVPDEPYHFWSSYALSDCLSGEPVDLQTGQIGVRSVDAATDLNTLKILNNASITSTFRNFEMFASDSTWTAIEISRDMMDFGVNPFYIKLPSAIGIILARVLNFGFLPLFFMGRTINYLLYAASVVCAVRITPVAKSGFRAVSLLPMSLHLAASYSYDSGILSLSFLLIAMLLRLVFDETRCFANSRGLYIASALTAVLLAPCKVIYFAIALVLALVPSKRFSSRSCALAYKGLVVFGGVALILLMRGVSIISLAGPASPSTKLDYRGDATGEFYSIADVLSNPTRTVLNFIRTMDVLGDYYLQTLVGGSLGWLQENIRVPMHYVFVYLVLLLLTFSRSGEEQESISINNRVVFLGVAGVCWVGAMLSMYFGHTFNTENIVMGVQGRYLLPVAPLLFLGARNNKIMYSGALERWAVAGTLAMNVLLLARTFCFALVA